MDVLVPPKKTRLRFWGFGFRLAPEYRPWVAQQITRPDYMRKRLWGLLGVQSAFVIVPQALLTIGDHNPFRLGLVAALVVFWTGYALVGTRRPKAMTEATRRRLLAYHGVTADGTLTTPVSALDGNPLGRVGLALLCAQVLVLSSGVAVAADRISEQRACHVPPAEDAAALAAAVGVPAPGGGGFGDPAPLVAQGTPLVAAREVDTGLRGMRFVAAYVPDTSGRLLGPAVWRVLDPGTYLNPQPTPDISAHDSLARQITPSTGYGWSTPENPAIKKARDCARAAR